MPIATLNGTAVHCRPRLMAELEFPGTPIPEGYLDSPVVPFPPVEAYADEFPSTPSDPDMALVVVRESLVDNTLSLLKTVQSFRGPATQEDVRRLVQIRAVVLGALETLKP